MKFPWTKQHETQMDKLRDIERSVDSMRNSLSTFQHDLMRTSKEQGPLVHVLVEAWADGHMADMGLTTLGTSGRAQRGKNIILETCVPLRNGRVTLFADFEKVEFRGVYLGNALLFVGGDWAPVLSFKTWKVGQRLNVICEPRVP